jgi:hypothetical protein
MTALMWIVCGLLICSMVVHIALVRVLIVAISRIMRLEIAIGSKAETEVKP